MRGLGSAVTLLALGLPLALARGAARTEPAGRTSGVPPSANAPQVVRVSLSAPDIVCLEVQAGWVIPSKLEQYRPRADDKPHAVGVATYLKRDGRDIGWLIGARKDALVTFERLVGDPLRGSVGSPAAYSVNGERPVAVYLKSRPNDWAQPSAAQPDHHGLAMLHTIYLKMEHPLASGATYHITITGLNVRNPEVTLECDPTRIRSEAVHVNQIGYRPDDPVKRAFLSLWLGTGGAYRFPDDLRFRLVRDSTGRTVFRGNVEKVLDADEPERMGHVQNYQKTNVYCMDFSAFRRAGRYRVVVDGVGCSYPFDIDGKVWERAFVTQMKGLYNQRSGIVLGPPYTAFRKPRDFHPADGASIYQSVYTVLDGGEQSLGLEKGSTGRLVPQAWGGYHDAGDWNPRRATHLRVTMAQMELLELFPGFFQRLSLDIPHRPGLPDILTEALFEVDLFRRLQAPDGGVGFGIETNGDPIEGEVSWLQSMPAYVYAPDLWSSYIYAAAAGRAAGLLSKYDTKLSALYRHSALAAMRWAEAQWSKRRASGTLGKLPWEVADDRNLAAVVLYGLTRDKYWHHVFIENTCLSSPQAKLYAWGDHVQEDAAFAYACLDARLTDGALRHNAIVGLEEMARACLDYARGNAYNLACPDRYRPTFAGFFSTPLATALARAHYLTGKPEYLAGLVRATQFQSGCNPNNMTYTVGVGANWPKHPLHLDGRRTGQPAPLGLTVFGNFDYNQQKDVWMTWPLTYHLNQVCTPPPSEWPIAEAYFDIFLFVAQNEFTVDTWTPNVYVWGYLAARGTSSRPHFAGRR